jgi:hypothetical protein
LLPSPFEFQNDDCQIQELSHKKLIDLVADAKLTRRHLKEAFVVIKRIQEAVRAGWQLDRLA